MPILQDSNKYPLYLYIFMCVFTFVWFLCFLQVVLVIMVITFSNKYNDFFQHLFQYRVHYWENDHLYQLGILICIGYQTVQMWSHICTGYLNRYKCVCRQSTVSPPFLFFSFSLPFFHFLFPLLLNHIFTSYILSIMYSYQESHVHSKNHSHIFITITKSRTYIHRNMNENIYLRGTRMISQEKRTRMNNKKQ
jgi:hypothetical protein